MPGVSDVTEIGDFWVGGAWAHFELSRYRQAAEICDEGLSAIAGRAPNLEIHIRAWRTGATTLRRCSSRWRPP
jgi:hypothetical protein